MAPSTRQGSGLQAPPRRPAAYEGAQLLPRAQVVLPIRRIARPDGNLQAPARQRRHGEEMSRLISSGTDLRF
jgi:hypothetical protein